MISLISSILTVTPLVTDPVMTNPVVEIIDYTNIGLMILIVVALILGVLLGLILWGYFKK